MDSQLTQGYSTADVVTKHRAWKNTTALCILPRTLKSHADNATAFLQFLGNTRLFELLDKGHTIVHIGDHPVQKYSRAFIQMGRKRGLPYLGELHAGVDAECYARVLKVNKLLESPETRVRVARYACS